MEEFMFNKIVLYVLLLITASFSNLLYSEVHWSEPSTLSSSKDLGNQQLAFNDAGQGIAVWSEIDHDKLTSQILYATCEDSKWSRPEVLASAPSFFGYSVAINNSGKAAIVWNTVSTGPVPTYCVVEARLFDGRSWGTVEVLHKNTFGGEFISIPKVALSESNEALVTWSTSTGADDLKLTALVYKDQAWSMPITLSTDLIREESFDIALNQNGQGIVAWVNSANAIDVKMYDQPSWSPIAKTISSPNVVPYTKIITSFADLPHPGVVWVAQDGREAATCKYCWFEPSGYWITPLSLGPFGGQDLYKFDLAVNTHGEGLVAWGGSDGVLKVNHFHSVNPPVISTLSTNFNAKTGSVNISINEKGNGAAIWNEGSDTIKGNVCVRTEWLPDSHTFSNTLEKSTIGQIAFDNTNKATALWIDGKGANGEDLIQTAFGKENADESFSHALNLQVTHCSHNNSIAVNWTLSSNPKIKGYALYRNNFLIAKFAASQTRYVDPRYESIIVYRIDALDQNDQVIATDHTKLN